MKKEEFESRLLEVWVETGIPLTQANVQYATGVSRKKVRTWLDELVVDGVLDVDADDEGLLRWSVRGSRRPANGARSFPEWERLRALRAEAGAEAQRTHEAKARLLDEARARKRAELERARQKKAARAEAGSLEDLRAELGRQGALELASRARSELTRKPKEGEKSILVSGGLSLVFGPLGWLYAGSFREALPAALVYLFAAALLTKLPMFLLMPVMLVALPLSAVAGVVYAWQYNRSGERKRLWGKDDDEPEM